MDRRIESMATTGSELAAEYVGDVITSAGKLTETLIDNVGRLTRDLIQDGAKVALAACEAFRPAEEEES